MTLRVLHCPTDTGRNPWMLAQAEKRHGVDTTVMVFSSSWLGYPADVNLELNKRSTAGKALALAGFLARAAREFDIIHFNFGRSLLSNMPSPLKLLEQADLPLLARMGKGIVVTYQGCDVRQRSYCQSHFATSACAASACQADCDATTDNERARAATKFAKYADTIYALNPDLLHVLPERASFLPYTVIDPTEWVPVDRVRRDGEPFRILHAPTDERIKGTAHVVEAVRRVGEVYPEVELVLMQGIPHSEVRSVYESADLVIDQLLVGWYGGFAVESMALGKPVVSYLREEDLEFVPQPMRDEIPVVNASPDTLYDVLLELIASRERLRELGARGRSYVEKWHDPYQIAGRTVANYREILEAKNSR